MTDSEISQNTSTIEKEIITKVCKFLNFSDIEIRKILEGDNPWYIREIARGVSKEASLRELEKIKEKVKNYKEFRDWIPRTRINLFIEESKRELEGKSC